MGAPKKLKTFNWEHPWEEKNNTKLIKSITQSAVTDLALAK